MKKWLVAALILLPPLFAFWWLQDDAPDPQAQAWLEDFEQRRSQHSDSFLHLLGIDADPATRPQELGLERLSAYHAWLDMGEPEGAPHLPPGTLQVPSVAQLCDAGEADCLKRVAEGEIDSARLLAENPVMQERYRAWRDGPAPRQQGLPGPADPIPNYVLLSQANRLLALQALQLLEQGNPAAARELLLEDIHALRRQLAEADNLIGKLVSANLIARDIQRLALWQARGLLPKGPQLTPLSEAERALLLPMQYEFAMIARVFRQLPEQAQARKEFGRVGVLVLFKPERSIKRAWPGYARIAELSRLSSAELEQGLREPQPPPVSPWLEPRNAAGQILLNIAAPAMETYPARLHDLDARIRLFNLIGQLPDEESELPTALTTLPGADNPYYPGQPPQWDTAKGTLCFDGPLPDDRGIRCLPLR